MVADSTSFPTLQTLEGPTGPKPERTGGAEVSLVVFHLEQARVMRLVEGQPMVVGRDPSAQISINDASVSRRHAVFELAQGVVSVSDLGSTNGTKLNGTPVQKSVVSLGDEVVMGSVTVSIHVLAPPSRPRHGAWSHDQFVVALEEEVERARAFQREVAVVMLRPRGDVGELTRTLRAELRPVDRLAHYGDGTIELLLPELGFEQTSALMKKRAAAMQIGVAVYPSDGTSAEALVEACRDAMHRAAPGPSVQGTEPAVRISTHGTGLLAVSPAMKEIFETVQRVANSVIPVLIRGETGTGKEVLSRALHERSPRAKQRLVTINCGAIPASLVESVLFGHEKGSFTGAVGAARGVFEEADGSTVLLDEVGELSPSTQAALLRVLETKEVRRVGASREIPVDVRVIAATHRDLEAMVKAGTFREDLMYRLNAMTLEVPPLRERPEEIGPFAERFVTLANAANGRNVTGIDVEAMRLLLRYSWPGNIRELRNAIEHAVVIARGPTLKLEDLPRKLRDFTATVLQVEEPETTPATLDLREGMQRYETQVILEALRSAKGNRTEAAKLLQIPVRTLSHKLKQLGIKKLGFGLDGNTDEG